MNIDISDVQEGGYYYHSNMTPELFGLTNFFKNYKKEKWGDYWLVKVRLVYWLDEMRRHAGAPIHIHCAYEDRARGFHPKGMAVDIHINGMSVLDQFLLACTIPFTGVGLYPYWNQRGLHVDIRPAVVKYFWYRDKQKEYHDFKSMKSIQSSDWYRFD
jgi:uncharacterized protein YcbK (DUF882 family)